MCDSPHEVDGIFIRDWLYRDTGSISFLHHLFLIVSPEYPWNRRHPRGQGVTKSPQERASLHPGGRETGSVGEYRGTMSGGIVLWIRVEYDSNTATLLCQVGLRSNNNSIGHTFEVESGCKIHLLFA